MHEHTQSAWFSIISWIKFDDLISIIGHIETESMVKVCGKVLVEAIFALFKYVDNQESVFRYILYFALLCILSLLYMEKKASKWSPSSLDYFFVFCLFSPFQS